MRFREKQGRYSNGAAPKWAESLDARSFDVKEVLGRGTFPGIKQEQFAKKPNEEPWLETEKRLLEKWRGDGREDGLGTQVT